MKQLHSFGTPVPCVTCGLTFLAVWAASQEDAARGQGQCDSCAAAASRAVANEALAADIEAAAIRHEEDTPPLAGRTGRYKGG